MASLSNKTLKMNKKNKNLKKQKKGNGNMYAEGLVNSRHIPFTYGSVVRDINLQIPIYAYYSVALGGSGYSFTATTVNITTDVLASFISSQEFVDLQDDFACYRIEGFYATYSSTIGPGLTSVQALTPAFIACNYGVTGSVNASNIARSDAAIELKMNNVGQGKQSLSYELPPLVIGTNGIPVFGLSTWFATNAPQIAGSLILMLGFLQSPTFASTASTQFIPVGVLDVHLKTRFAQPILD